MKNRVNTANAGHFSSYRPPSRVMAARVPLELADAIERYRRASGQSATDAIIQALEAFFSAKK